MDEFMHLSHDEIQSVFNELQVKYRDNMKKLSINEKKRHLEFLRNAVEVIKQIINEVSQKLEDEAGKSLDANDEDKAVLKMSGNFFVNASGLIKPEKEILNTALNSASTRRWDKEDSIIVSVESIVVEENFHHILEGPNSPNYLMKEHEVYVRLQSTEQAAFVLGICSHGRSIPVSMTNGENSRRLMMGFQFSEPCRNARTRAAYREIGTLITRLRQIDAQLRTIGAVPMNPGRGGVPRLPATLVQKEEFDERVDQLRKATSGELHAYVSTRIRVDRKERQRKLDSLIDERINILLKLAQFDPDEFPFVVEREFK